MGGCVSSNYHDQNLQSEYLCGVCNKELSDRYLECSYCKNYTHYACSRLSSYSLEHCIICGRMGGLIKRFNADLDKNRVNTI